MTIQSPTIEAPTAVQPKLRFTPEEYFAHEERAEYKSEYHNGEILPMTGGSINHNRIARNGLTLLTVQLQDSSCEPFGSDMRIWIADHQLCTYPDLAVICGEPLFYANRNDTITNPVLIVEVLSPSTEDYDRGRKFQAYRTLPSLQDYLLIQQEAPLVEHFHKLDDGRWVLTELKQMTAAVALEALKLELPLARIYERVDWEEQV